MTVTAVSLQSSRDFELWKLGFAQLMKAADPGRVSQIRYEKGLKGDTFPEAGNMLVVSASGLQSGLLPGYKSDASAEKALHSLSERVAASSGTEHATLATMALSALTKPSNLPDRLIERESAAKRQRCVIALRALGDYAHHAPDTRSLSYLEFVRWELASFLDGIAPRANIHAFALGSVQAGKDAAYDIYDVTLRMSKNLVPIVHENADIYEILAVASNADILVTDSREMAAIGRRCGAATAFLSDRFADDVPEADIYGPGFFEPFTFSRAALDRRLAALKAKEQIIAARTGIAAHVANALAACKKSDIVIIA